MGQYGTVENTKKERKRADKQKPKAKSDDLGAGSVRQEPESGVFSRARRWVMRVVKSFRNDYQFATALTSALSACFNIAFAVFNGVFGLSHYSVWHLSVFGYYALLLGIRGHILISLRKKRAPKPVYIRTHLLLVVMNLSMIIPAVIMVNGEREYSYGLIPAIAMAAYTTYRIVMTSVHLKKAKKTRSILIKELRTINFVDALVAVMTLQNTMIMANSGMTEGMKVLCGWSNGGIIVSILMISVYSLFRIRHAADRPPQAVPKDRAN